VLNSNKKVCFGSDAGVCIDAAKVRPSNEWLKWFVSLKIFVEVRFGSDSVCIDAAEVRFCGCRPFVDVLIRILSSGGFSSHTLTLRWKLRMFVSSSWCADARRNCDGTGLLVCRWCYCNRTAGSCETLTEA